jgi:predicted RNA-binding Zn-ribbon protein involved in translation (DUF1610 family)
MPARSYATVGRASDNDVVIDHPTVSGHHARLSWQGSMLVVEDLSSANGTYADGQPVRKAQVRLGAELRFGQAALPWSHEGLRALLKSGVGKRTLVMQQGSAQALVCGGCGHVAHGAPPAGAKTFACPSCGATLRLAQKPAGQGSVVLSGLVYFGFLAAATFFGLTLWQRMGLRDGLPTNGAAVKDALSNLATLDKLGPGTAQHIAAALTPTDALTRDTAIRIAAKAQGTYNAEQVAELWNAVRSSWRYVNDPNGSEYFATASETIKNGYIGDCDDFAITLASMVLAIGGNARVVLMDGPEGGHAYAEACVPAEPKALAKELGKYYRTRWKQYLQGRVVPTSMAYRASADCPVWLNLDWNSSVPGGAYQTERWAVAIYADGHSEEVPVEDALVDVSGK